MGDDDAIRDLECLLRALHQPDFNGRRAEWFDAKWADSAGTVVDLGSPLGSSVGPQWGAYRTLGIFTPARFVGTSITGVWRVIFSAEAHVVPDEMQRIEQVDLEGSVTI